MNQQSSPSVPLLAVGSSGYETTTALLAGSTDQKRLWQAVLEASATIAGDSASSGTREFRSARK
jgi:hypothetical protein